MYDREGLIVDELLGAAMVSHTRFSPVSGLVESWFAIQSAGRPTAAQHAASTATAAPEVCVTVQYIDPETRLVLETAQKAKTDVHHRRKEMRKLFNIEEDYIVDFSCNLDGSKIPGSGRVYITATQLLYNSTFKQKIMAIEDIRSVEKYKTLLLANAGIKLFMQNGRKIHLKSFKDRKAFITSLQAQAKVLGLPPIPIIDKGSSEDSAGEQEDDEDGDSASASRSALPPSDTSTGTASPPPGVASSSHFTHHISSPSCPSDWTSTTQTLTPPTAHVRASSGKLRDSGAHYGSAEAPASTSWMASEAKHEKSHKESHRRTPSAVAASMFKSVSEKIRNISNSSSNIKDSKSAINADRSDLPSTPTGSSHPVPIPLGNSSENQSSGGQVAPIPLRSSGSALQRDGSNGSSLPTGSPQPHQTPSSIALNGQSSSPPLTGSGSIPVNMGSHSAHSAPVLIPNKESSPASSASGPVGTPTKTAKGEKTSIFGAPAFLKDLSLPFHLPGSKRKRAASTSQNNIDGPVTNEGALETSTSSESEESDREREESRRLKFYLIHGEVPAGSGEEESELDTGRRHKKSASLASLRQATSSITRSLVPMDDEGSGLDPSSPTAQRPRPKTASQTSTTDSSDTSDESSSSLSPMLSVRSHTTQDDPDLLDGAQDTPSDTRSSLSKKSRPPSGSNTPESSSPDPLIGSRGDSSFATAENGAHYKEDGSRSHFDSPPLQLSQHTHALLAHNLHASAPPPQFNKPLEDLDRSDELETLSKQQRQSVKVGSGHIRAAPSNTGSPRGAPPSTSFNREKDITPTLFHPSPKMGTQNANASYLAQSHQIALSSPNSKTTPLLNQSYAYGSTKHGNGQEEESFSDSASDSIAGSTDHSSSSPVRSRKGDSSSTTSSHRLGNSGDSQRSKKSYGGKGKKNNVSVSRGSIGKAPLASAPLRGSGPVPTLGKSAKLKRSTHGSTPDLQPSLNKKHKHKRKNSQFMSTVMLGAKTTCFGFVLALAILLRVMIGATLSNAQGNAIGAVAVTGMSKSQKFFELANVSLLTAIGTLLSQMMSVFVAPKVLAPRLRQRGLLCENVFVREHIVPLLALIAGHCIAVCFGIALLACAPLYAPAHTIAFLNANADVLLLRVKTCALYVLFSSVGCHLIARHHSGAFA